MAIIKPITKLEDLDRLFDLSNQQPVVIFKHSRTCGISADVLESVNSVNGEINIVVVQDFRQISDELAARTGIRHHSPQAFVISNGSVVYHATHYGIDSRQIQSHLRNQ